MRALRECQGDRRALAEENARLFQRLAAVHKALGGTEDETTLQAVTRALSHIKGT